MKKVECKLCGINVSPNNITKHTNSKTCQKNQSKNHDKVDESLKQNNGLYQCHVCKKEFHKKGIRYHIWKNHGGGQNFTANNDGYKNGSRKVWNKGLTKETSKIINIIAKKQTGISTGPISTETKQKLSKIMKNKIHNGDYAGWDRRRRFKKNKTLGSKPAIFYICKFKNNNMEFIKIGLTSRSIKK